MTKIKESVRQGQEELNKLLSADGVVFNLKLLKRFLDMGADVNSRDQHYGWTPLLNATYVYSLWYDAFDKNPELQEQLLEAIQLLIERGADINAKDNEGQDALLGLVRSIESPEDPLFQYLMKCGADISTKNNFQYTLLHNARKPGMVQFLVDQGLDVNAVTSSGISPLASREDLESVKILVEAGADIDAVDLHSGNSYLIDICSHDTNIANYLLDKGASPNIRNRNGETALHRLLNAQRPFAADSSEEERESHAQRSKLIDRLLEVTEL